MSRLQELRDESGRFGEVLKEEAPLILAAPDLLAACKKALDAIRWWEGEHPCCNGATGEQEAAIRAAIAKAEGRP
jgi:hypothetical protein